MIKSKLPRAGLNTETIDEASRWFVEFRLGELDRAARERFIEWLQASPAHIRAYMEIAGTYTEMAPPNARVNLDVERLIAEARSENHIVELPNSSTRHVPKESQPNPPRPLSSGASWGLAACVLLALVGSAIWYGQNRNTYETQIGEQRSITLSDGSRVDLNARSKVRIRLGPKARRIELVRGQALFHVARDANRPFVVHAERTSIRAVGTSFDVNRIRSGTTTVTVLEGRVAVGSSAHPGGVGAVRPARPGRASRESNPKTPVGPGEILLSTGEQLRLTASAPSVPTPVNVQAATAWTQHQLIFESTPLQEVVEQFNRYNVRQIVIHDRSLQSFQVSGYYSTPNPDSLINFLRTEPHIEVRESRDSIDITRR